MGALALVAMLMLSAVAVPVLAGTVTEDVINRESGTTPSQLYVGFDTDSSSSVTVQYEAYNNSSSTWESINETTITVDGRQTATQDLSNYTASDYTQFRVTTNSGADPVLVGLETASDPYTSHTPEGYVLTRDDSKTPETVFAEFTSNGDVDVTVEAYNDTAGSYEQVTSSTVTVSNASADSPSVEEFDVSNYTAADYTKFRVTTHGQDATNTGVFYEGTSSGGAAGTSSSEGIVSALMDTTIGGIPVILFPVVSLVGLVVVALNRADSYR